MDNSKLFSKELTTGNLLIPKSDLKIRDGLIRQAIKQPGRKQWTEVDDNFYGPAFTYYLLFSEPSALQEVGFPEMSEESTFYNRYYWFMLFIRLYQTKHGYDAGLEQQAFKLLETTKISIDWAVIEDISSLVTEDASR